MLEFATARADVLLAPVAESSRRYRWRVSRCCLFSAGDA
jgi:hypothetical protein